MKRILSLILLLCFLVGCSNVSKRNNLNEDDAMKDINITEIELYNIEWSEIPFSVDLDEDVLKEIKPIETNQIAKEVATAIIEKLHQKGKLPEYTLVSIIHSIEDDVWCFEYSIDQRDENVDNLVDCGCLYIAIDGKEGSFIKAWLEE